MDDLKKVTEHLQYLFLIKIANALKGDQIDIPTARLLAQKFLKIEPFVSIEDAKNKVDQFSTENIILAQLKDYIDGYFYEHHKDALIEQMKTHINAGNIDQALSLVKK